nr:hypothetical protein CFP56_23447 [Quercus suber]
MNLINGVSSVVGRHLICPISVIQISKCPVPSTFSGLNLESTAAAPEEPHLRRTRRDAATREGRCRPRVCAASGRVLPRGAPNSRRTGPIHAKSDRLLPPFFFFENPALVLQSGQPVGRAGGLALFWSLGVELEVVYSDKNVISALVYSDPPQYAMDAFCYLWALDFMTNTGAIDLGFNGPSFTWSNRREGLANIKERLDQCLCDRDWQILFPKVGVKHLSNANSDHNPILLDTHLELDNLNRPFRFEAMWTKDERSNIVVENAWQANVEGSNGFRLARKLEETKKDLRKWNKEVFGLVRERIKAIQANIAELQ